MAIITKLEVVWSGMKETVQLLRQLNFIFGSLEAAPPVLDSFEFHPTGFFLENFIIFFYKTTIFLYGSVIIDFSLVTNEIFLTKHWLPLLKH